jgi:phosphinothricin acetyltransferase
MAVKIRFANPDDAAGMLAIYAPFCDSSYVSFEVVAPSLSDMRERIARVTTQYPWLVGEIDAQLAAYVYASQHRERAAYRWVVDVAVYVATEHRRRRLGRALYTSLFSILRAQGYVRAYAGIALPNAESVGLHESVGFSALGVFPGVGFKLGRWLDLGWWGLDLQPATRQPAEPRPIGEVLGCDEVVAALREGEEIANRRSGADC